MNKRASGPPRRPRNPIAKNVRTPLYKPRVEQDKRWQERVKDLERAEQPEVSEEDEASGESGQDE